MATTPKKITRIDTMSEPCFFRAARRYFSKQPVAEDMGIPRGEDSMPGSPKIPLENAAAGNCGNVPWGSEDPEKLGGFMRAIISAQWCHLPWRITAMSPVRAPISPISPVISGI